MADLTNIEKHKLENALISCGYVLGFTNKTFAEFFEDFGIDIYGDEYADEGDSKAKRMRAFWKKGDNYFVGKVLQNLFDNWDAYGNPSNPPSDACLGIARRLLQSAPVNLGDLDSEDGVIVALAEEIKNGIQQNRPEFCLDRMHTLLIRRFRSLCDKHGVSCRQDEPLDGIFGKYVKTLEKRGLIESEMTRRILKTTISVMASFNHVRNNQSYAHPNQPLNRQESRFIIRGVENVLQFVSELEKSGKTPLTESDFSEFF